MITMEQLMIAGRALVAFGVALLIIPMVLPDQVASAMKERTGLFGLVVAGLVAIFSGFVVATVGGR